MSSDRPVYRWLYDHIVCHYYDIMLKWCFFPLGGEDEVRRTLIDEIDLEEGDKILEMCCGTGNTSLALARRLGEDSLIKGVDLSAGQIRMAQRKNRLPNIEFLVMDAADTCFADGYFDQVVIPHALHEMPRDKRLAVLEEARRVVRNGGSLAVFEMDNPPNRFLRLFFALWWFYWLPFNPETPTRKDMLKHGVVEELEEAGFSDVRKVSMFAGALQVVKGGR